MNWKSFEEVWDEIDNWWGEEYIIDGIAGINNGGIHYQFYEGEQSNLFFYPHSSEIPVLCDKVRYYVVMADTDPDLQAIFILADTGTGIWITIYAGQPGPFNRWVEKSVPGGPLFIKKFYIFFENNDEEAELPTYILFSEFEYSQVIGGAVRPLVNGSLASGSPLIKGGLAR